MKRIAILLACVVLAGCAGTVTQEQISNTTAQVSSTTKSAPKESSASNANVSQSSLYASASSSVSKDTRTDAARLKNMRAVKKYYREYYDYTDAVFTFAEIPNDSCMKISAASGGSFEKDVAFPLNDKQQKAAEDALLKHYVRYFREPSMTLDYARSTVQFYDYGETDGYRVYYIYENGNMYRDSLSYNRLAGYQFGCYAVDRYREDSAYDKDGNIKKGLSVKAGIYYSGIFLVKDNQAAALEDLYLDGKIEDAVVANVYALLPNALQRGYYPHYREAFALSGGSGVQLSNMQSDEMVDVGGYIAYFDRDGKFHVVVA